LQTKVPDAPPTAAAVADTTAVTLRGVARRFGDVTALAHLDLHIAPGEILAVVGPSGCGKSTLLELVAGLLRPDAGTLEISGSPKPLDACALMPQRDLLLPWRDALGNAALALECAGVPAAEARGRAAPLFERFGLAEFEHARPAELSGGMRQRVAFIRTILPGRPVLLLDEPFAALDAITRQALQQWLSDALAEDPRTVLLVTHDVEEAVYLADRVAVLSPRPGRVVAEIAVDRPHPRDRRAAVTDPELARLRERALEALR
jgi:ABC-type nitrate/sulfonate/bicarbonate transport system ATPase subunit